MHNFQYESTLPLNEHTIALYEEEYKNAQRSNPELIRKITEIEEVEVPSVEINVD